MPQFQEDFDQFADYRTEGKQPPKKQPKPPYQAPHPMDSSPDMPSASMPEVEFDVDSSPIVQYVQAPQVPKKPAQPAPAPNTYLYMEYEVEEKKIQLDPSLYASHPMHHCLNICEHIKDCMLMCERTMHLLMARPDAHIHRRQIALLQDCAEVCFLTTRQVARCSPMMKTALKYCAKVCRMCAHECMGFPDPESQACARMCLHCSEVCALFATKYRFQ